MIDSTGKSIKAFCLLASACASLWAFSVNATYSLEQVNNVIKTAKEAGEPWTNSIAKYPLYVFDFEEVRQFRYDMTFNSAESPSQSTVSIEFDGYLDDSIQGEILTVEFEKAESGWVAVAFDSEQICARGVDAESQLCL
ncbi:hypothetical protein [Thaumasiovibrio subtropicus]|uniref:hypothetical protein n=1 Tax=Thaumasiovibrio subtropicus TaxID=1891207 RepID=UPI000B353EFA|nr:hypothetical protein [Thaumasiovibrio subtropicus]